MVVIDGGVRYCFTGNKNITDVESQFVILTDRTPTKQKLIDGTVRQVKWLRHPQMVAYTPEEVNVSVTNTGLSEVDEAGKFPVIKHYVWETVVTVDEDFVFDLFRSHG